MLLAVLVLHKTRHRKEQQVLESLRKRGLATDQINGVGPRNKNKDIYMDAAKKQFGD